MPSPIPRCLSAVLLSLASRRVGGLRLFRTSSAFTLPFSRLARRSLMLWPARSLVAFSATFFTEGFVRNSCPLQTLRLLPAGATVARWHILLPLEGCALFTAHAKLRLARFPAIADQDPKPSEGVAGNNIASQNRTSYRTQPHSGALMHKERLTKIGARFVNLVDIAMLGIGEAIVRASATSVGPKASL